MRADPRVRTLGRRRLRRGAVARILATLLVTALMVGAAGRAAAEPAIGVRAGMHRQFGRLVFDFPRLVAYNLVRSGTLVVLTFVDAASIGEPDRLPPNVRAFVAKRGEARVTIVPGAAVRTFRVGRRIVLDVLNPTRAVQPGPTGGLARAADPPSPLLLAAAVLPLPPPSIPLPLPPIPGKIAKPAPAHILAAPPAIASPAIAPPAATNAPVIATVTPSAAPSGMPAPVATPSEPAPPTVLFGPLALAARRVAAPPGAEAAILIPFGPRTGAAALRRGDNGVVVFDTARPIDMSGLAGDPAFGAARVSLLPAGTVLRVPLPPTLRLSLSHRRSGWVVGITAGPSSARAIVSTVKEGSLALPMATAAQVVIVPDPMSGTSLLVGTARVPGRAVALTRRVPDFVLLRTWLGVAIEPLTDRLVLRAGTQGFRLAADGKGGLALAAPPPHLAALESAATLTRRFDFPALPRVALARRLYQQLDAAVAKPRLDRFGSRLGEAETMVALGMGPEAMALIKLAGIDDPRHSNNAGANGLAAIAALLAGRLDRSTGLDDPRLSGTDEIALWRAARAALLHQDPAGTAPVFAATAGLILAYPAALRNFLAPIAADAMVRGDALAAAGQFLKQLPNTPPLDFARALLLAAHGKTAAALTAYDRLAHSLDRRVAARAASHAVLLRLANGAMTPMAAADALSRQFYDWRGGRHELALRFKVAELRANAGEWRQALALLRRTQHLFPAQAAAVRSARAATFRRLFRGNAAERVQPLDLVSLIEDNADLIPPGRRGERLGEMLADRLLALDLPDRAAPVLAKLMQAAPPGAPQAGIGARLAAVRLAENDPSRALAALAASRAASLPRPLAVRRTMIYARAVAAEGHTGKAVAALDTVNSPAATGLAADLLQKAGNWPGAEAALAALAAQKVPAKGALSSADQNLLVRLASASTEAGDASELALLRATFGARIGQGSLADMFRLLTDPPAHGLVDLTRVQRETAIAGQLPTELKAIGGTMRLVP
ncbi:MAG: hypothetical protein M0002_09370 [Rhodospirillales bacterium]|nr:hypothetical protein [Rhodospirillales bacterium]